MSEGTGAEGDGGDANATDKENLEPAKGDNDMDVDGTMFYDTFSLVYTNFHIDCNLCKFNQNHYSYLLLLNQFFSHKRLK